MNQSEQIFLFLIVFDDCFMLYVHFLHFFVFPQKGDVSVRAVNKNLHDECGGYILQYRLKKQMEEKSTSNVLDSIKLHQF